MLKCKCLSCHCFALSGKRNYYYSGDQHKFPGSECQKQAKMQSILDVKCKLCCDISGVLPKVPTSFLHNNIKYFPVSPRTHMYVWEPYRKADLSSILGDDSHTVCRLSNIHDNGCNVRNVTILKVPLQNCKCQFRWHQPFWVTPPIKCNVWNSSYKNPDTGILTKC